MYSISKQVTLLSVFLRLSPGDLKGLYACLLKVLIPLAFLTQHDPQH